MIFVDTSFWVALSRSKDVHHVAARELFEKHHKELLATSNHVRGETWTVLRRRAGHRAAVTFCELLDATSRVHVEFVSHRLEDAALNWLRSRPEREFSFVDATSFAVMREAGMTSALAFDGDFAAAGFIELR
ncbi:MAG: type II toxin-antitoxin system VapC family toxin [Egibacteraceae bacterium]